MISYKVLIALTVTYIICCSCGVGGEMRLSDCCNKLSNAGFSATSGLLNYCFVRQFLLNEVLNENTQLNIMDAESQYQSLDHDQKETIINKSFEKFNEFVKNPYTMQRLHDIVKEFFKYNANITVDSKLKTPKEFCTDLRNSNKQPGCWMFCAKSPKISIEECVAEIFTTLDEKIILRIDDGIPGKPQERMENIKYGNDKFKNLIKTNTLSAEFGGKSNYIINNLSDFKKKYYEYQIDIIEKTKNDGVFQNYRRWCTETKGLD